VGHGNISIVDDKVGDLDTCFMSIFVRFFIMAKVDSLDQIRHYRKLARNR
jgi:hypothetical protein